MSTYRLNFTNQRQIFSLTEQEYLFELSGRLPLSPTMRQGNILSLKNILSMPTKIR